MRITILSKIDYAASGHKMCEALQKHTDHDVEIWTGDKRLYPLTNLKEELMNRRFRHPNKTNVVNPFTRRRVQDRVDASDIVHVKGDWPAVDGYLGLKISHKPVIQTTSGSSFRKRIFGGREKWIPNDYKEVTLRTAFEPDLLYADYGDVWIPHPIDSVGKENLWKDSGPIVLMHSPTNRKVKGTWFVESVFEKLKQKYDMECVILENMLFEDVVEERKRATIFFDQFLVGFYGNSALEAMQHGIPVAAWISDMAVTKARGALDGCPVITNRIVADEFAGVIYNLLEYNKIKEISLKTKEWCDNVHSYQAVAKKCDQLYKQTAWKRRGSGKNYLESIFIFKK